MTELRVAHVSAWEGEAAAIRHFGADAARLHRPSLDAVHDAVVQGDAAYGLLPLESSTEGMVNRSHDLLFKGEVQVVGELLQPLASPAAPAGPPPCMRHAVVARPGHPGDVRDDRLMLAALLPPGPGSLLDLLQPLARRQLSVEHWCSRPARVGGWHYRFHFTLQGAPDQEHVRQALQEAASRCRELKVLGRFRAARP